MSTGTRDATMMTLYKDLFLMATQSKRIQFGQVAELQWPAMNQMAHSDSIYIEGQQLPPGQHGRITYSLRSWVF